MELEHSLKALSDDELLRRLLDLLRHSRRVEADLVAHIGEVDSRRLYAREAVPSMFAYCTEVLHLSEAEAYLRITVARAARDQPLLLDMMRDGRLHLSAIAKLLPHLTGENREAVLARAAHRSKRAVEELIAELAPRPDAPTLVRALPQRTSEQPPLRLEASGLQLRPDGVAGQASALPLAVPVAATMQATAPARYRIQFTARAEFVRKLDRLKALMWSAVPDGDLAALIEEAVTEKLARLEARRFGTVAAPRKRLGEATPRARSRHIPAPVRRAVHARDGGRCRYVDARGARCSARDNLEFHHRHPFGYGGDHDPENLSLMCRTHNAYLAEVDYGKPAQRRVSTVDRVSQPSGGLWPGVSSVSGPPDGA